MCVCVYVKGVCVDFASSKPRSRIKFPRLEIEVLDDMDENFIDI